MIIQCCKDCTKRAIGCHGRCEKYNSEKDEHAKLRKKAKLEREYDSFAITHSIMKHCNFMRKHGNRRTM